MKIEFIASLPPIQSAISLDGMGDGGRVKLDISRRYSQELLLLQQMAGKQIKIIAESIEDDSFDLAKVLEMQKL